MYAEIIAYSHVTCSVAAKMVVEPDVGLKDRDVEKFVTSLSHLRNSSFNIELRVKDQPIHRILNVAYNEVWNLVFELGVMLKRVLSDGEKCSTCQCILCYVLRTNEIVDIIIEPMRTRVRVQDIYEAKCSSCGQRYMRFEKVVEMAAI